jgi:homoserine kinase
MPKTIDLIDKLRGAGLAAVLSGAGPSVLVLYSGSDSEIDQIQNQVSEIAKGFTSMKLAIARSGVE